MFEFSSKTQVAQKFKIAELLKILHADKELKTEASNIENVQMINALSQSTTGLNPSDEVNEIYVIEITLKNEDVPMGFIKALDKTIQFQVLYKIICNDKVKWVSAPKYIVDNKVSQSKHFETNFDKDETKKLPLVNSLAELYKQILSQITGLQFRPNETLKNWEQRHHDIESLKKEFEKTEKMIKSETQPKKKFAYNEKLREIYQKIRNMQEIKNEQF